VNTVGSEEAVVDSLPQAVGINGVAEIGNDSRISRFVEKPPKGKAPSNFINAGVYVLSPEVFDYIPSGRAVSVEREVFHRSRADDTAQVVRFRVEHIREPAGIDGDRGRGRSDAQLRILRFMLTNNDAESRDFVARESWLGHFERI